MSDDFQYIIVNGGWVPWDGTPVFGSDAIIVNPSPPHPSPLRYLRARCGVRYWEDARVDGVKDMDGSRVPCREGTPADNTPLGGGIWCPTIELETGRIEGWPAGTKAKILYKVCDRGEYEWLDANRNVVKVIKGYVPAILSPADEPDGDYVSMVVGPDGLIEDWRNIPPPAE